MKAPFCVRMDWLADSLGGYRLGRRKKRLFYFNLSRLLKGGLAIHRSLTVLARNEASKDMKSMLSAFQNQIQEGKALSEVMSRCSGVFTSCEWRLVAAGEASGRLEDVLDAIAADLHKDEETRAVIRGAVAYPLFILALGVFTFLFLVFFIIPRLSLLYQDFGQSLPVLTLGVIRVSQWIRMAVLGLTLPGIVFFYFRKKMPGVSGLAVRLPLWEDLFKTGKLARFSALLALLLKSGIPAIEALGLAADAAPDESGKREILRVRQAIEAGRTFADSLENLFFMDGTARALIASGEESGRICEALDEIAEMNAADLESRSKLILKLLEPALILFIGGVIGFVVIAMLFPIVTMSAVVQ